MIFTAREIQAAPDYFMPPVKTIQGAARGPALCARRGWERSGSPVRRIGKGTSGSRATDSGTCMASSPARKYCILRVRPG